MFGHLLLNKYDFVVQTMDHCMDPSSSHVYKHGYKAYAVRGEGSGVKILMPKI